MTRRQALARAYVDALRKDLLKQHGDNTEFVAWLEREYRARVFERAVDNILVAYGRSEARPPS